MNMADPVFNPRRPKGKRRSRRLADLERQLKDVANVVGIQAGLIEDLKRRIDDLEYFRENAKEILDIQEIMKE